MNIKFNFLFFFFLFSFFLFLQFPNHGMEWTAESDLLTFAQRKQHYESDKSYRKELFTSDTRPHSVRVLYDEAGKITPPPTPATGLSAASTAVGSPTTAAFDILTADGNEATLLLADGGALATNGVGGANLMTAGSDDDLLCPFGNSNRKMRKRIDAEIEIRLVSWQKIKIKNIYGKLGNIFKIMSKA